MEPIYIAKFAVPGPFLLSLDPPMKLYILWAALKFFRWLITLWKRKIW